MKVSFDNVYTPSHPSTSKHMGTPVPTKVPKHFDDAAYNVVNLLRDLITKAEWLEECVELLRIRFKDSLTHDPEIEVWCVVCVKVPDDSLEIEIKKESRRSSFSAETAVNRPSVLANDVFAEIVRTLWQIKQKGVAISDAVKLIDSGEGIQFLPATFSDAMNKTAPHKDLRVKI